DAYVQSPARPGQYERQAARNHDLAQGLQSSGTIVARYFKVDRVNLPHYGHRIDEERKKRGERDDRDARRGTYSQYNHDDGQHGNLRDWMKCGDERIEKPA